MVVWNLQEKTLLNKRELRPFLCWLGRNFLIQKKKKNQFLIAWYDA